MTYLITFSTYGSHLHGDPRGSVDPKHNTPGWVVRASEPRLERYERRRMSGDAYSLSEKRRGSVMRGLIEACARRNWILCAAHVRVNHVHAVVEADCSGEAVLHGLKAYASKKLNEIEGSCPRWTRHGSTRQLRGVESRRRAIHYVANEQGEPMTLLVT